MRLTFLPLFVVLVLHPAAFAADWFKLGGKEFAARLAVTIENPADADNPAVLVTMPLVELGEAMPAATASTIAVADESHTIVPFQISRLDRDHLIFVVPVKARSSRTIYVYASKDPLSVPKFAPMTGTDSREAWRSFENEFMGFRVEVGEKAKTTGLAIDIFGKTREGHGAQLKNIYASDYHERQPWGIDVMKVGTGPGLGGAYMFVGESQGRTGALSTSFKVICEGPIASCVQASGPVKVRGVSYTLTRTIHCLAGDRALHDEVRVMRDDKGSTDDVKIGLGLRDLPNQTWVEKPEDGYCFVHGDGNQKGTEKLGLGTAFDQANYEITQHISDTQNGGHIYLFTPHHDRDGAARLTARLLAFWDGDGWIKSADDFEKVLAQHAELSKSAPKVEIAKEPEIR